MGDVRLDGVSAVLDGRPVLVDVDAEIPDGAFSAVIGPSGSGKSTLLRVIAGLVPVATGRVLIGGRDVTGSEPRERNIGMVFQMPAMLPHRNVRRNVSFPLELRREAIDSIRRRVDAESRAMQIEHLLLRNPEKLSRGEQQLVQIARTMVRAPGTLLLDEPFAPLDANLRVTMRTEIGMLQRGYGITTVMATNDPADVTALATHVLVLSRADPSDPESPFTVVQAGAPREVERDPVSLEVAGAVGSLWTMRAVVRAEGGGFWLDVDDAPGVRTRAWSPSLSGSAGSAVLLGFGSGDLVAHPKGEIEAVLDRRVPGAGDPLLCRIGRNIVQASTGDRDVTTFEVGAPIRLDVRRALVFDPPTGRRLA